MKVQHKDPLETKIDVRAPWTIQTPTPPPGKNYGRHSMELHFAVIGKKGAISLVIFTDQYALEDRQNPELRPGSVTFEELYIHSRYKKHVDIDTARIGECHLLEGECYGQLWTSLGDIWKRFISNNEPTKIGATPIWNELAERYYEFFYDNC
jgi:hypothetical protein